MLSPRCSPSSYQEALAVQVEALAQRLLRSASYRAAYRDAPKSISGTFSESGSLVFLVSILVSIVCDQLLTAASGLCSITLDRRDRQQDREISQVSPQSHCPQSRRSLRIAAATWPSDSFNWLISSDRVLPTRFHWT